MMTFILDKVENIGGKGENAGYQSPSRVVVCYSHHTPLQQAK